MYLWKRFQFFDASNVMEKDQKHNLRIFHDFTPSCSCGAAGALVFGDSMGVIRALNEDMALTHNFQAFKQRVVALARPKKESPSLLVALGHDISDVPSLKIYAMDRRNDQTGNPTEIKLREIQVSCRGSPPPPVRGSALAVSDDFSQIAVGTEQGSIFLISGDIFKRPQFQLLAVKGPSVTGLFFNDDDDDASSQNLYTVTEKTVDSYYTRHNNNKVSLEREAGGKIHCSAVDPKTKQLLVGRDKAVYRYMADSKGICYGFDNDKRMVSWFGEYLVLICRDTKRSDSVTFYDLKNKLIAFTQKIDPVATVAADFGKFFIVTESGKAIALTEKSLDAKMKILQRTHLYSIAISLAVSKGQSESYIMKIFKMSADHKRDKGDYAGAMADYLKTIGHVEPSYVIRQFLDAQRIVHLASYLEALHDRGLANKDHTTLLLKCYTKLKIPEKLDKFLQEAEKKTASRAASSSSSPAAGGGGGGGGADHPVESASFDVEAAIEVCFKAGHYEQARSLAKRWQYHAWYLRVSLEKLSSPSDALVYISTLPPSLQSEFLGKYGKTLIEEDAKTTTRLLSNICGKKTERKLRPKADKFLHIFLGEPRRFLDFLKKVVEEVPNQSAVVYNTLLDLYLTVHLYDDDHHPSSSSSKHRVEVGDQDPLRKGVVAKAGKHDDTKLTPQQIEEREANFQKAMLLLKSQQACYDVNQALVSAKIHKFEKGMIYLYEKLRLFGEILQYYMETGNHKRLIRACVNHGTTDPDLWVQALKYFAEHEDPCEDEIAQVLEHIEDPKIQLAPLMVLQILSSHAKKPFGVIKDYVIRILQREKDQIEEDEKAIEKFQHETSTMRKEIEDLTTKPTTFMPSRDLMLPAVHFLCKHSYHEQVIGSRECPKCAPEYRSVMEIKEQVRQSASQHELFFKMLEGSNDGFGVVAEYFGRGILDFEKSED